MNVRVQTPAHKAFVLLQIAVGSKKTNVSDFGLKVILYGDVVCYIIVLVLNIIFVQVEQSEIVESAMRVLVMDLTSILMCTYLLMLSHFLFSLH